MVTACLLYYLFLRKRTPNGLNNLRCARSHSLTVCSPEINLPSTLYVRLYFVFKGFDDLDFITSNHAAFSNTITIVLLLLVGSSMFFETNIYIFHKLLSTFLVCDTRIKATGYHLVMKGSHVLYEKCLLFNLFAQLILSFPSTLPGSSPLSLVGFLPLVANQETRIFHHRWLKRTLIVVRGFAFRR